MIQFRAEPKVRPESRGLVFDVSMIQFRAEPKGRHEPRGLVFDGSESVGSVEIRAQ